MCIRHTNSTGQRAGNCSALIQLVAAVVVVAQTKTHRRCELFTGSQAFRILQMHCCCMSDNGLATLLGGCFGVRRGYVKLCLAAHPLRFVVLCGSVSACAPTAHLPECIPVALFSIYENVYTCYVDAYVYLQVSLHMCTNSRHKDMRRRMYVLVGTYVLLCVRTYV